MRPFRAITKHADVIAISKNPTLFQNAPRLAVFPGLETEVPNDEPPPARHLINMDPPEHGQFRRLVSSRFAPRQLMPMAVEVEGITRNIYDEFAQGGCSRGPRCRRHRGAQRQRRSAPRRVRVQAPAATRTKNSTVSDAGEGMRRLAPAVP